MDFIEKLKEQYGTNTPIIAGEIKVEGMNEDTIRQNLSRQTKIGRLQKYAQGIYYIAEQAEQKISDRQVYEKRFITDGKEVYGYYSGKSFEYELGIVNKAPEVIEIVTNKETSRGREIKIGDQKVYIKKGYAEIERENVDILALLSYLNSIKFMNTDSSHIREYIKNKHITKEHLFQWLGCYPAKLAKQIVISDIIRLFE